MWKSLFDPEGAFARGTELLGQLVLVNVLFLLCSLPVVTMGISATAASAVLLRIQRGEDRHVVRQFFAAFRENWKCAGITWLVVLLTLGICLADLYIALALDSFLWKVVAMAGLNVVGLVCAFLFPLQARYENTCRNHLRNAVVLGIAHLPRLLLVWLTWMVPVLLTFWTVQTFYSLLIIWLLLGFSSLQYVTLRILRPVFRSLEEPEDKENKE